MNRIFCWIALVSLLALVSCQKEVDLIAKGDNFMADKKPADAEIQYRRAIQQSPRSATAHLKLAGALQQLGQQKEALEALLIANDANPDYPEAQKELVDLLLQIFLSSPRRPKALYDQLQDLSHKLTTRDPTSFLAKRVSGILLLVDRRYPEAIEQLRDAVAKQPDHEQSNLALIEALYGDRQVQEAELLGSAYLRKNPKSAGVYDRLYGIYLAANRPSEALRILQSKVVMFPQSSAAVVQLARHYFSVEKSGDKGMAELNRLVENPAQFTDGALAAADFMISAGQIKLAASTLEKGLSSNTARAVDMRKLLADCYMNLNQREKAIEQLALAQKASPEDDSIPLARAIIDLSSMSRPAAEDALKLLDELNQKATNDPRIDFHRGRALFVLGKVNEAVQALQEATRKRRSYVEPRYALVTHYLSSGKPGEALRELDQIDLYAPENPKAAIYRLEALRATKRYEEAGNLLRQAQKAFPQEEEFLLEEGLLALDQNRPAETIRVLRPLFEKGRVGTPLVAALVRAYLSTNQPAPALATVNKTLAQAPDRADIKALRADVLARQDKPLEAIAILEPLIQKAQPNPFLLFTLAPLYARTGQPAKAIELYKSLASMGANPIQSYTGWIAAAQEARQPAMILEACREWTTKAKDDWISFNNCAYVLANAAGDLEVAESYARQASRMQPQQQNVRDTLGFVLLQRRKFPEALQIYETLCRQEPKNPTFRFHLGIAQRGTGNQAQAKATFDEALRLKPPASLANKIQEARKVL